MRGIGPRRDNHSVRASRDRSPLSFVLMGAALGLLMLLAFLQYQWIGQLSQAEQERLQAHLRAALWRFTQEFNAELARIPLALLLGRPSPPGRELADLAERYQSWRDVAAYPELVREFWVTGGGAAGLDQIWAYQPRSARFEPASWPERLSALRVRLQARADEGGRRLGPWLRWLLDDESGLLVAPRFQAGFGRGLFPPGGRPERGGEFAGWAIAELNLDFIGREFLAELVDRHFRRAQGFDFQVQVVRKSDRKVIYRSDPSLPHEPLASPDATAGIFEFRLGLLRAFSEGGPGGTPAEAALAQAAPGPVRVEPEGRWQVLVQHRAGSLEAAVNQVRWRNLAISFGVLLLMAASLAMLLVSSQRAHRLARLQMEFVAGVSHELRTPLAVICSAGDNLADGLIATGEQARRYGALIRTEGRKLTEMVEQILTFAGAQAGRLKYHFQPVDVGEVIERVATALEPEAREAGMVIEKRVDDDVPLAIADPVALGQCLRNLVHNAVKYAAAGRWVGVTAARTADGRRVEIRVEDRGPGIAPADLPHIFEPFYRGGNAGQGQVRGAGLGLSLVKGVIEAHRGSVRVESRLGEGSRFILQLPAAGEQRAATPGEEGRHEDGGER